MPDTDTIKRIKAKLDNHIGSHLTVTTQIGRKNVQVRRGVLISTFPSVFIVDLDVEDKQRRVSFSYIDVLTKDIELEFREVI